MDSNEETVKLLKRVIVYVTRPVNQMSEQARKDVGALELLINDYGGDTRNDLRTLDLKPYDIGDSNDRQNEFMQKHQDEPNVDGPDDNDI